MPRGHRFAPDVTFVPYWEPLSAGFDDEQCGCGCASPRDLASGAGCPATAFGEVDGGQGARKSVKDLQAGGGGGGGTGAGAGGTGGSGGDPALGAAEVAALDAFLAGVTEAVAEGDHAAAWGAYQDYADYMGQLVHQAPWGDTGTDPPEWYDTVGGCSVGSYAACGDPRFALGVRSALPDDRWLHRLAPLMNDSLEGAWTTCDRELVLAAWILLADNLDLVRWAVCVGTGNPASGECVERFVLCDTRMYVSIRSCPQNANSGGGIGSVEDLALAAAVAAAAGAFAAPMEWAAPAAWGIFVRPEIHLCEENLMSKTRDMYCNCTDPGQIPDDHASECAVLAVAANLLHEMTHLCNRAGLDHADHCRVSYLVANYFLWGASSRFPGAGASPCCSLPNRAFRTPGVDAMDSAWSPAFPVSCVHCVVGILAPSSGTGLDGLVPTHSSS